MKYSQHFDCLDLLCPKREYTVLYNTNDSHGGSLIFVPTFSSNFGLASTAKSISEFYRLIIKIYVFGQLWNLDVGLYILLHTCVIKYRIAAV